MLLDELKQYPTVEEAAQAMAGNYRQWRNFHWFGESQTPNPEEIMLGYIVGAEHTAGQLADLEVVRAALAPYKPALADDFGSSVSGDPDILQGVLVRVRQNGEITEPFRKLYELAQRYRKGEPLDQDTFKRVSRQEMLRWVELEVPYICLDNHLPFNDSMPANVVEELHLEGLNHDTADLDDVERIVRELAA